MQWVDVPFLYRHAWKINWLLAAGILADRCRILANDPLLLEIETTILCGNYIQGLDSRTNLVVIEATPAIPLRLTAILTLAPRKFR